MKHLITEEHAEENVHLKEQFKLYPPPAALLPARLNVFLKCDYLHKFYNASRLKIQPA